MLSVRSAPTVAWRICAMRMSLRTSAIMSLITELALVVERTALEQTLTRLEESDAPTPLMLRVVTPSRQCVPLVFGEAVA